MFFSLIAIISCSPSAYYTQALDFEDGAWDNSDVLTSQFSIADTTKAYNLFLDVDHSSEYHYENIYLSITTEFPHKDAVSQVLPIDLANKKGQWHGKCHGDNCNLRVVLKEATRFDAPGDYTLSIAQHSREEALSGISSVEFLMIEVEK